MPVSCVTLTAVGPANTPGGASHDEQQSTAAGNSFDNDGATMLYVRNGNASARTLTFYADRYGVERTVMTQAIPGSGTEHGVQVLGPFPPGVFGDHSTTDSTKQGHVMFTHSGADGDIFLTPIKINRSLLHG